MPPGIATARASLTPMLSQYADLCAAHEDALVLFQVGDFYEAFCEAAETVARVCEVTLTERSDSTGEYPMAGIPIDAAASYLESLLEADYRVALADGLVDRAVTEVLTPGTAVDDELVESGTTTYVGAVARESVADTGGDVDDDRAAPTLGLAVVDVTTGECLVTDGDPGTVTEEVARLAPAELIVGPGLDPASSPNDARSDAPGSTDGSPHGGDPTDANSTVDDFDPRVGDPDRAVHRHDPDVFGRDAAVERLAPYDGALDRRLETDAALRAAGAVLAYAEYAQGDDGPLEYVSRVRRYEPDARLRLDAAAQRSLELFETPTRSGRDTTRSTRSSTAHSCARRSPTRSRPPTTSSASSRGSPAGAPTPETSGRSTPRWLSSRTCGRRWPSHLTPTVRETLVTRRRTRTTPRRRRPSAREPRTSGTFASGSTNSPTSAT
jgi:DNA mismatch repair protein MutS